MIRRCSYHNSIPSHAKNTSPYFGRGIKGEGYAKNTSPYFGRGIKGEGYLIKIEEVNKQSYNLALDKIGKNSISSYAKRG
jgi:hypothetical protein